MTKKDFISVAMVILKRLEEVKGNTDQFAAVAQVAYDLEPIFRSENPKFSSSRWRSACGLTPRE